MPKLTGISASNQRGFTLIEVLISITILSLMTFGIVSFTDFVISNSDKTVEDDKDYLKIETAMARFEWDISQIFSPLYFDITMRPSAMTPEEGEIYNQLLDAYQNNERFTQLSYEGLPIPLFENPEKNEFIFLTTSNRRKLANSKQSRFAWVRYTLGDAPERVDDPNLALGQVEGDKEENKGKLILVRQIYNKDIFNPESIPWDDIKTQVLLRNVESLVFEYWNPETFKWTENLRTIKDGVHLIHGVKVSIKFYDYYNIERYTERIFRPLFPQFEPEDVYQFLKPKPRRNSETGAAI